MGIKELTSLEALENIKNLFIGSSIDLSHQLKVIEKALQKYEMMKFNADFIIKKTGNNMDDLIKKLKALEIIRDRKKLRVREKDGNYYLTAHAGEDMTIITKKNSIY